MILHGQLDIGQLARWLQKNRDESIVVLLIREDREPHIRKRRRFLIKENELVRNHRVSRKAAVAKLVSNSISSLCSSSQSEKVLKYNFLDLRK